jgi:hypothetical protein
MTLLDEVANLVDAMHAEALGDENEFEHTSASLFRYVRAFRSIINRYQPVSGCVSNDLGPVATPPPRKGKEEDNTSVRDLEIK